MSLPLEQQVCSLKLSKKLKKLGVGQDSYFFWHDFTDVPIGTWQIGFKGEFSTLKGVSAFTVAELGEILPTLCLSGRNFTGEWKCTGLGATLFVDAKTEADARAKMLIHLIEQGIVKVEKC